MKRRRGKGYAQATKQQNKPAKGERFRLPPLRNRTATSRRNASCPCGSGKKFKACCGCPAPPAIRSNPYQTLAVQYTPEQKAAEAEFVKQWGFNPNPGQLMAYMEGAHEEIQSSVLHGMTNIDADPKFHYAVEKLGRLITPKNQKLVTEQETEEWEAAIAEYAEQAAKA